MSANDLDAITRAAAQANTANEYRMSGDSAVISGLGAKSQAALNFAQGLLLNTAPTVAAAAVSPEAAYVTALTTVVAKTTGKIGWKL